MFLWFDMILGSESYVWTMMWWLIVTVYDMTFILSLNHCIDCGLSVLSVFILAVFLPTWCINDIFRVCTVRCFNLSRAVSETHCNFYSFGRAVLTNRHTGHVFKAPYFFSFWGAPKWLWWNKFFKTNYLIVAINETVLRLTVFVIQNRLIVKGCAAVLVLRWDSCR